MRGFKKIEGLTDNPDMAQYIDVEKGMELGRKEDIEKASKKMLEDNLDINTISKYTNLSIDEIKKLT